MLLVLKCYRQLYRSCQNVFHGDTTSFNGNHIDRERREGGERGMYLVLIVWWVWDVPEVVGAPSGSLCG